MDQSDGSMTTRPTPPAGAAAATWKQWTHAAVVITGMDCVEHIAANVLHQPMSFMSWTCGLFTMAIICEWNKRV